MSEQERPRRFPGQTLDPGIALARTKQELEAAEVGVQERDRIIERLREALRRALSQLDRGFVSEAKATLAVATKREDDDETAALGDTEQGDFVSRKRRARERAALGDTQ